MGYFAFGAHNHLKKTICFSLSIIIFTQQALFAHLPQQIAFLKSEYLSDKQPLIIFQDVHAHPEAQRNIAKALTHLLGQSAGKPLVAALEGAEGSFDFSTYWEFPDKKITRKIAEEFLSENRLTGPILLGLTDNRAKLVGAEEASLYRAHVDAYRQAQPFQTAWRQEIKKATQALKQQKKETFTGALLAFDELVTGFNDGKIPLSRMVDELIRDSDQPYLTLETFAAAHELESKLDYIRVETERRQFIQDLAGKLTSKEMLWLSRLISPENPNPSSQRFRHLLLVAGQKGIRNETYTNLRQYNRYAELAESISSDKLFEELRKAEADKFRRLAEPGGDKARRLIHESRSLYLLEKLVGFELTPEEWREYSLHHKGTRRFSPHKPLPIHSFERFYELAESRNLAFIQNALNQKAGVLIAGGFHTHGLTEILRKKNKPFRVYRPKITDFQHYLAASHLTLFAQKKTPLEKLFSDWKLLLSLPAAIGTKPLVETPHNDLPARFAEREISYNRVNGPKSVEAAQKVAHKLLHQNEMPSKSWAGSITRHLSRASLKETTKYMWPFVIGSLLWPDSYFSLPFILLGLFTNNYLFPKNHPKDGYLSERRNISVVFSASYLIAFAGLCGIGVNTEGSTAIALLVKILLHEWNTQAYKSPTALGSRPWLAFLKAIRAADVPVLMTENADVAAPNEEAAANGQGENPLLSTANGTVSVTPLPTPAEIEAQLRAALERWRTSNYEDRSAIDDVYSRYKWIYDKEGFGVENKDDDSDKQINFIEGMGKALLSLDDSELSKLIENHVLFGFHKFDTDSDSSLSSSILDVYFNLARYYRHKNEPTPEEQRRYEAIAGALGKTFADFLKTRHAGNLNQKFGEQISGAMVYFTELRAFEQAIAMADFLTTHITSVGDLLGFTKAFTFKEISYMQIGDLFKSVLDGGEYAAALNHIGLKNNFVQAENLTYRVYALFRLSYSMSRIGFHESSLYYIDLALGLMGNHVARGLLRRRTEQKVRMLRAYNRAVIDPSFAEQAVEECRALYGELLAINDESDSDDELRKVFDVDQAQQMLLGVLQESGRRGNVAHFEEALQLVTTIQPVTEERVAHLLQDPPREENNPLIFKPIQIDTSEFQHVPLNDAEYLTHLEIHIRRNLGLAYERADDGRWREEQNRSSDLLGARQVNLNFNTITECQHGLSVAAQHVWKGEISQAIKILEGMRARIDEAPPSDLSHRQVDLLGRVISVHRAWAYSYKYKEDNGWDHGDIYDALSEAFHDLPDSRYAAALARDLRENHFPFTKLVDACADLLNQKAFENESMRYHIWVFANTLDPASMAAKKAHAPKKPPVPKLKPAPITPVAPAMESLHDLTVKAARDFEKEMENMVSDLRPRIKSARGLKEGGKAEEESVVSSYVARMNKAYGSIVLPVVPLVVYSGCYEWITALVDLIVRIQDRVSNALGINRTHPPPVLARYLLNGPHRVGAFPRILSALNHPLVQMFLDDYKAKRAAYQALRGKGKTKITLAGKPARGKDQALVSAPSASDLGRRVRDTETQVIAPIGEPYLIAFTGLGTPRLLGDFDRLMNTLESHRHSMTVFQDVAALGRLYVYAQGCLERLLGERDKWVPRLHALIHKPRGETKGDLGPQMKACTLLVRHALTNPQKSFADRAEDIRRILARMLELNLNIKTTQANLSEILADYFQMRPGDAGIGGLFGRTLKVADNYDEAGSDASMVFHLSLLMDMACTVGDNVPDALEQIKKVIHDKFYLWSLPESDQYRELTIQFIDAVQRAKRGEPADFLPGGSRQGLYTVSESTVHMWRMTAAFWAGDIDLAGKEFRNLMDAYPKAYSNNYAVDDIAYWVVGYPGIREAFLTCARTALKTDASLGTETTERLFEIVATAESPDELSLLCDHLKKGKVTKNLDGLIKSTESRIKNQLGEEVWLARIQGTLAAGNIAGAAGLLDQARAQLGPEFGAAVGEEITKRKKAMLDESEMERQLADAAALYANFQFEETAAAVDRIPTEGRRPEQTAACAALRHKAAHMAEAWNLYLLEFEDPKERIIWDEEVLKEVDKAVGDQPKDPTVRAFLRRLADVTRATGELRDRRPGVALPILTPHNHQDMDTRLSGLIAQARHEIQQSRDYFDRAKKESGKGNWLGARAKIAEDQLEEPGIDEMDEKDWGTIHCAIRCFQHNANNREMINLLLEKAQLCFDNLRYYEAQELLLVAHRHSGINAGDEFRDARAKLEKIRQGARAREIVQDFRKMYSVYKAKVEADLHRAMRGMPADQATADNVKSRIFHFEEWSYNEEKEQLYIPSVYIEFEDTSVSRQPIPKDRKGKGPVKLIAPRQRKYWRIVDGNIQNAGPIPPGNYELLWFLGDGALPLRLTLPLAAIEHQDGGKGFVFNLDQKSHELLKTNLVLLKCRPATMVWVEDRQTQNWANNLNTVTTNLMNSLDRGAPQPTTGDPVLDEYLGLVMAPRKVSSEGGLPFYDTKLADDEDQREVVRLSATPAVTAVAVQGAPGAGKTRVIRESMAQLVAPKGNAKGEIVLGYCHSNRALDEIAERLMDTKEGTLPAVPFVRAAANDLRISEKVKPIYEQRLELLMSYLEAHHAEGKGFVWLATNNGMDHRSKQLLRMYLNGEPMNRIRVKFNQYMKRDPAPRKPMAPGEMEPDDFTRSETKVVVFQDEGSLANVGEALQPFIDWNVKAYRTFGDKNQMPSRNLTMEEIEEIRIEMEEHGMIPSVGGSFNHLFPDNIEDVFEQSFMERGYAYQEKWRGIPTPYLRKSWRLHWAILYVINRLFYGGKLRNKHYPVEDPLELQELEPLDADTIALINLDLNSTDGQVGLRVGEDHQGNIEQYWERVEKGELPKSKRNFPEAGEAMRAANYFLGLNGPAGKRRYKPQDIFILSPYRAQNSLIDQVFLISGILNDMAAGLEKGQAVPDDQYHQVRSLLTIHGKDRLPADHIEKALELIAELRQVNSAGKKKKTVTAGGNPNAILKDIHNTLQPLYDIAFSGSHLITRSDVLEQKSETDGERDEGLDGDDDDKDRTPEPVLKARTFDGIQGGETDVSILSMTRSNPDGKIGFLKRKTGLKRLNVGLTRSRKNLVVIGSFDTLKKGSPLFGRLIDLTSEVYASAGQEFKVRPRAPKSMTSSLRDAWGISFGDPANDKAFDIAIAPLESAAGLALLGFGLMQTDVALLILYSAAGLVMAVWNLTALHYLRKSHAKTRSLRDDLLFFGRGALLYVLAFYLALLVIWGLGLQPVAAFWLAFIPPVLDHFAKNLKVYYPDAFSLLSQALKPASSLKVNTINGVRPILLEQVDVPTGPVLKNKRLSRRPVLAAV